MKSPLTTIQQEVLNYIKDHLAEHGYSPTLDKISRHFDWTSINSATGHVNALCRKGYLKRHGHHLKVMGSDLCPCCARPLERPETQANA